MSRLHCNTSTVGVSGKNAAHSKYITISKSISHLHAHNITRGFRSYHSKRSIQKDPLVCNGFFSGLFGDNTSKDESTQLETNSSGNREDWSSENLDEVVFMDTTDVNGIAGKVVYRNGGVVDATALETLCDRVGWPRRPMNKVEAALANSFLVSTLTFETGDLDNPTSSRLIGLARCTSDGAFNATIWDVLVDPEFQGNGLGKALVEQMVRTLLKREITNITLFADAKVVDFYKQLGFEADPEGIRGMFWYPRF